MSKPKPGAPVDHLRGWLAESPAHAPPEVEETPSGIGVLFNTTPSTHADHAWEPGTVIDRYEITRVLGAGGMGTVFEARDSKLKRRVALKRLHGVASAHRSRARDRLLREAQALAQVSHPSVVHLYDCALLDDALYLVMEYIDGEPLRTWLQKPRTVKDVVAVFTAIGAGLAAAHDAGIVHRDFKPDNVMIDRYGRPRVLDFGLARAMRGEVPPAETSDEDGTPPSLVSAQLTGAGRVAGTPLYMAPEQILGAEAGAHSDQFSFCVSLFEALLGRRPFAGTGSALFRAIVHEPVNIPSVAKPPAPGAKGMPAGLTHLLTIGLAKRPEQRFTNMRHLLATLDATPLHVGSELASLTSTTVMDTSAELEDVLPELDEDDDETIDVSANLGPPSGIASAEPVASAMADHGARDATTTSPFALPAAATPPPPRSTTPLRRVGLAVLAGGLLLLVGVVLGARCSRGASAPTPAAASAPTVSPPTAIPSASTTPSSAVSY